MNPFNQFFPDPDEEQQSKRHINIFERGVFALPDFYPASVLGSKLNTESLLFSEDGLKGSGKLAELQALEKPQNASLFKIPEDIDPILALYGEEKKSPEQASGPIEDISEDKEIENIWLDPATAKPVDKPSYHTWDSFLLPEANNPVAPYLTEAGSEVFDAALEYHQNDVFFPNQAGIVIRNDVFLVCLLHLGLGRSSVLFQYNKERKGFVPVREKLRISGCSVEAAGSIFKLFKQCGEHIKYLERFAKRVYKERGATPTRIAIAECTMSIVNALQTRLSVPASSIHSLIHLESLFREPALILSCFHRIVLEVRAIEEDSKLLSRLFQVIQRLQYTGGSGWLRPILMEVMRRVSRAWLEFVEEWIGLSHSLCFGMTSPDFNKFFVAIENDSTVDEKGETRAEKHYVLDKTKIPSFMTAEDSEIMFECGKSLRFLQRFHPKHPLCTLRQSVIETPKLDWKFSWEDLEGIHKAAQEYERALRRAISRYRELQDSNIPQSGEMDIDQKQEDVTYDACSAFAKPEEEIKNFFTTTLSAMSAPLPPLDDVEDPDPLRRIILHISRSNSDHLTTFAPPMDITPLLSFSQIFSVQSRLVNAACLRMFFQEHRMREHFCLLHRFQLLGDGVFKSRLTHALFDEELDPTERGVSGTYRTGGTMGLRLGARDSWPPASSELRLALMGILTEAYHDSNSSHNLRRKEEADSLPKVPHDAFLGRANGIPGNLSFSIRELSVEEYQMCLDPNSISALDFLKIYYKPPSPLDSIITKTSIYHYDRIFKFLLRVLRMNHLVNRLWREYNSRSSSHFLNRKEGAKGETQIFKQKFLVDSHHFVTSLSSYIFDIGVKYNWSAFRNKLDKISEACQKEDEEALYQESLSRLRAYHNKVLDRIMFATLLRRRQEPVMKLLETIFNAILAFAKLLCHHSNVIEIEELKSQYVTFRRITKTFIDVIRGLSEKRGYGDGRVTEDGTQREQANVLFGKKTMGGYREEGVLLGMLVGRLEGGEMGRGVGYYGKSSSEGGGKGIRGEET